jgi:hypothetical protein
VFGCNAKGMGLSRLILLPEPVSIRLLCFYSCIGCQAVGGGLREVQLLCLQVLEVASNPYRQIGSATNPSCHCTAD